MKFLVLGIGNIMFADEGLGVHLCKQLQKNYKFSHFDFTLDFIDGGTLALQLSYIIARYDRLIVLDCIEAQDASIGDVFFFPYDAMPNKISWSGSAHEIEMLQTLQYMELAGDLPKTHILACVPKRIEAMSFKLSDELIQGAKIMEKTLLDFLSKEGFAYEKIADFSLQELADISYKNY
ncbi:HyaD/HybD family hydrogenase maturation endopeptidase [Campylobacter jejuni]|nr:HyaD/HybD family hydrogenase maturation endopeptidase [Campylobacter jejuni]